MADERVPGLEDQGSLIWMIRNAGYVADDDVAGLAALAARVQEHRVEIGVSRVHGPTRSTTLWAAMQLDQRLRETLERTGVNAAKLAEGLHLRTDSFPEKPAPSQLHSDFARAMSSHLSQRRTDSPVTAKEIVLAILQSVRTFKGGALPGYLGDVSGAIAALRKDPSQAPNGRATGPARFSRSVRDLDSRFGETLEVTAGQIATALQTAVHRDYAGGTFLSASFDESGTRMTFHRWCARIEALYDMEEVRISSHQVIDGRLFLVGLTILDRPFARELDRTGIRARLADELTVWPRAPELLGGVSSEHVDPTEGIALDRDRMGVAPYVSMLATVICDRQTPMPLSIGIFGEWGSGKSYFMGLLRYRIDVVRGSDEGKYWNDIRQISFNAWHYADSNLWASLGDEIFRQLLNEPDPDKTRQDALREELGERFEQRKELDVAASQARTEADRLRRNLDAAVARRDATARDLVTAVARSEKFKEQTDKVWSMLGVSDAVDQARLLAEEVAGTKTDVHTTPRLLWSPYGMVAAVAAVLILLAVAIAAWFPADGAAWRSVVSGLSVTLAVATWMTARARRGLAALHALASDIRGQLETVVQERTSEELANPVARLQEAEAARERAESQLAAVTLRVSELERELAELAPGQRLYSFLADRVAAGEYTRNLGLITTIRNDLGHLSDLMDNWRKRATKDEEAPRPIDRIVLYIDDLDRCSPQQVVSVLQAVHLLLALDLFVAVVGVDPRWLVRSLQREYPRLLDPPGVGDQYGDGWDASPEDYLEKIFGIPLVLPGMQGQLEGVLRGIFADSEAGSSEQPEISTAQQTDAETDTDTEGTTTSTLTHSAPITSEPGSEIAAQDSREPVPPQSLTDAEIELLAALEPLVRTPREAKRLANVYRMIRSSKDLSKTSTFLGGVGRAGEFQAVIVLLALLNAHARLLGAVLDAMPNPDPKAGISGGLMHRPPTESWVDFVADLQPHRQGNSWTNRVVGPLTETEATSWLTLWRGLGELTSKVTLADLTSLQTWAPSIRRFSFVLPPR